MNDYVPTSLHDYLLDALANLNNARNDIVNGRVAHREAALHAIAEAEKDIGHVIGLIAGPPS